MMCEMYGETDRHARTRQSTSVQKRRDPTENSPYTHTVNASRREIEVNVVGFMSMDLSSAIQNLI